MTDSRPRLVVTHWAHPEVQAYLAEHFHLTCNETLETWPREHVRDLCRQAHGAMMFMPDWVDDAFLAACPDLRIVSAALKGYDNFDAKAFTNRKIWLTIVPDRLAEPTADLAVALLLALTRNVLQGDRWIRGADFAGWRPRLYGTELSGRTAGIIGMGSVGKALATRLRAFGLQIQDIISDEQLAQSDFVFPLLPLTPATLHYLDAKRLACLQPGAYLINVGRGSLVKEQDVAAALATGRLAGYAADVFEMEDWALPNRPLTIARELLNPAFNTVFTPHLGSATHHHRREIALDAARELVEVLIHNRRPRNPAAPIEP